MTSQEEIEKKKKDEIGSIIAKRYQNQEPLFRPPPLPIQRRTVLVDSGAEHPPSFFQSEYDHQKKSLAAATSSVSTNVDKIQSRQFDVNVQQLDTQPFHQPNSFNNFPVQQQQQQQNNFQQAQPNQQFQPRQQNSLDQSQFTQFNQQPQQNFQQPQQFQQQGQQQQSFQSSNNFQSRQQENLPTLPPVFIPPNQPIGPPPALQSPIRNLFREPEPSFSLAGIFQRFLRLFNIGNN